jgi:site-specific DNA recombinase
MVVAYTRVSSGDDADVNSLSLQASRIGAQAAIHGRTIDRVFIDNGISGGRRDRPALIELLSLVKQHKVKVIYVTALDRLSRKLSHLVEMIEMFEKCGVALVTLRECADTSTSAGRLMLNMLGSVAQFEREATSDRMRESSAERMRLGLRYSVRVPFGYCVTNDQRLVPSDPEQAIISEMRAWRAAGVSYARIAKTLNARGVKPRSAVRWYGATVRNVLTSAIAKRAA